MGKTGKQIFLCGDYVDAYFCDQCKDVNICTFQHWEDKDFTLCAACLEKAFKDLFEPSKKAAAINIRKKASIPHKVKKAMFERDAYRCRYCGSQKDLVADHVFPESRGGQTTIDNLATACNSCNTKKGARTPQEAGMKLFPIDE